ncbi:MAG: MFS transporter, partial [Chloroflexota bacterium]|nr:MFS transporter [Chloroflexota bacterium]
MEHTLSYKPRMLFYTLYIAYVCAGIISILPGPTLPLLAAHTSVPLATAGWIFTMSAIGFMGGVFLAGIAVSKTGPKYILIAGLSLLALAGIITPLAHSFVLLLSIQLVEGVGFGFLDVSINIIATLTFAETLGETLNNLHSSYGVGALIAPLLLSAALEMTQNSFWAYLIGSLIGILGIVFLLRQSVPRISQAKQVEQQQPSLKYVLSQPLLW